MGKTRGFWKDFAFTFKESKYLIFKYCFAALFWTIISILTNLLDVESLTYLNAYSNIIAFANVLGFGISCGINVLVNQNINNPKKVQFYSSIGFWWSVAMSAIVLAVLFAFPKFILNNIMGLQVSDYTFYYVMCIYFAFYLIYNYLTNLLKLVKSFVHSMICDVMPLILGILGFVILYFTGNYVLNYMAIIYCIIGFAGVLYGILALLKNKKIRINVLLPKGDKLTWKQNGIILTNMSVEFMMQIGSFAMGIFLIRMGDAVFNTYFYLDIAFDVFNGFFYALMSLSSIRIARSLGRSKFDEAYAQGKRAILFSLVIGLGYAVGVAIFAYPFALGANDAYFNIIFYAMALYLCFDLFRFLSQGMVSYILPTGGKNWVGLIAYGLRTVGFVVLAFVAEFLPKNIFVAYAIMMSMEAVAILIGLGYFLSRKWMANVNRNVKAAPEQIKAYVFDFDEAVGSFLNNKEVEEKANEFFYQHFSYISDNMVDALLEPCGKNFGDRISVEDLEKTLILAEGQTMAWEKFLHKNHLHKPTRKIVVFDDENIAKFKQPWAKFYLVSNFNAKQVREFLAENKIDVGIFDKIYLGNRKSYTLTKAQKIKRVISKQRLLADEVFLLADGVDGVLAAKGIKTNYFKFNRAIVFDEVYSEAK